jgi:membrane protease YdiL (CAAX protease family)
MILPGRLFAAPFPWLPTVVGLCLTAAFLHTAHILLSGFGTWGFFRPVYIWMSLSAAVIEELAFRGFLFNRQAAALRVRWAAMVNGLLFALYHFPEFLLGQNLGALLGLRFWVIAAAGFLFSMAFWKWKHLGMTVVIHFVWNMLCFWFALA